MGSFTDDVEKKVLDHLTGKQAMATVTAFVGLSIGDPLDDESGLVEPIAMGYTRVETVPADWNAAIGGSPSSVSNLLDIAFPQATGDWGTLTHFALFSAATGADKMLVHGALTSSKHIENGETAKFVGGEPGSLVLTLD